MNELDSVLNNIQHFFNEGIIDEIQANELAEKANNDYNELIDNNSNNGEFNSMSNMAEFSSATQTNYFGDSMLALGEALGYEDVVDYAEDLGEALGFDSEEILAVLAGDLLPTADLVELIAGSLDLDEDIYNDLNEAAMESVVEDAEMYSDEDEDDYYDDDVYDYYEDDDDYYVDEDYYDDDDAYDLEEAMYEQDLANSETEEVALAALEEAQEANYNAAVLQEQLAEFSAVAEVSSALNDRDMYAQSLVGQGKMPPAVYYDLFGNFSSSDDRIAAFSQVCEVNGTDASSELYSIDKILDTFESYGDTALFNRHAYDVMDEEEVLEELIEYDQASLNRQLAEMKRANLI